MDNIHLIRLNQDKYAIRTNDIKDIKKTGTIHSLTFNSRDIQIYSTLIDDKFFYFFDLAMYFKYQSNCTNNEGNIFIISKKDEINGFIVNNENLNTISPDNIMSLPEYLKSDIIDSCAIVSNEPIPIININNIHNNLKQCNYKLPSLHYFLDKKKQIQINSVQNFIIYKINKHYFCIPENDIADIQLIPDHISQLPFFPDFINGIAFMKNKLITIIKLHVFPGDFSKNNNTLFTLTIGRQIFGFRVDSYKKSIYSQNAKIFKLPLLVRSKWINYVIIKKDKIYPVLDIYHLLNNTKGKIEKKNFSEQYKPKSKFPDSFLKKDIEILEFEIFGVQYGIPKEEVIKHFVSLPYQEIPNNNQIIIGISVYKNEILPVLDITKFLGIRSDMKSNWQMILVKNGNFKALIIVEKILGWKKIALENERHLPFEQKYPFVYGCHIDNIVKLILNIEAIAIYHKEFDYEKYIQVSPKKLDSYKKKILETEKIKPSGIKKEFLKVKSKSIIVEEGLQKINDESPEVKESSTPKIEDQSPDFKKKQPGVKEGRLPGIKDESPGVNVTSTPKIEDESPGFEEKSPEVNEGSPPGIKDESPGIKINALRTKEKSLESKNKPQKNNIKTTKKDKPSHLTRKNKYAIILLLFIIGLTLSLIYKNLTQITIKKENRDEVISQKKTTDEIFSKNESADKTTITKLTTDEKTAHKVSSDKIVTKKQINNIKSSKKKTTIIVTSEIENEIIHLTDDKKITFKNILFPPDSSELPMGEKETLNQIKKIMIKYKNNDIRLAGHTALHGTKLGRKILSGERARNTGQYLISIGACREKQITYKSMGATIPIADNNTPEGKKRNRRVEITIFK